MACSRAVGITTAFPTCVSRCGSLETTSSSSTSVNPNRRLLPPWTETVTNLSCTQRIFARKLNRTRRCAVSEPSSSNEGKFLPDLQVPKEYVAPETAAKEAEWLRGALHQWLDDEFCPEPANEEISRRCSKVYYYCLLEEQLDVGDILMQMVRDLETFSFKQSFHGAFSSANAAIDLITKRMRAREPSSN